MDQFEDINLTTTIKDSLPRLKNRDLTTLTASSGNSFPQEVSEDMIGRLVNRVDIKYIYSLDSVDPVTWIPVLNYGADIPDGKEIESLYQPVNKNLTALSSVRGNRDLVPYFLTSDQMSTIQLNDFTKQFFSFTDVSQITTLLGLGALAFKNSINGATDITNSSITKDKLAFTPIEHNEGFATGDLKETYDTTVEEGWINFAGSIGSANSSASRKGDDCKNLYKLMWNVNGVTISGGKGSSAESDWNANKTLTFPSKPSVFANTNLRIKL